MLCWVCLLIVKLQWVSACWNGLKLRSSCLTDLRLYDKNLLPGALEAGYGFVAGEAKVYVAGRYMRGLDVY